MCDICGLLWCSDRCPNYDPRRDPAVTGFCEECGEPLYVRDATLCAVCGEESEAKCGEC